MPLPNTFICFSTSRENPKKMVGRELMRVRTAGRQEGELECGVPRTASGPSGTKVCGRYPLGIAVPRP